MFGIFNKKEQQEKESKKNKRGLFNMLWRYGDKQDKDEESNKNKTISPTDTIEINKDRKSVTSEIDDSDEMAKKIEDLVQKELEDIVNTSDTSSVKGSSTTSPSDSRRGSGSGEYTESRKSTPKKKNPPVEVTKKVETTSPPKSPTLVLSEPAKERKNTLTSTDSSVLKVAEALEEKPRRGSTSEEKSPGKRLNLKGSMEKIFRRNSKEKIPQPSPDDFLPICDDPTFQLSEELIAQFTENEKDFNSSVKNWMDMSVIDITQDLHVIRSMSIRKIISQVKLSRSGSTVGNEFEDDVEEEDPFAEMEREEKKKEEKAKSRGQQPQFTQTQANLLARFAETSESSFTL